MIRNELVNLAERVMAAEGMEGEHGDLARLLEENVPHPRVLDLIYYSDPPLTAEEVVDKALAYRPIEL
ncbi:hypothetical protein [Streptomyces sp. ME19-01-6]|uniref:hypothetical protein n=1 Tax=Streptomyces sp. ME19-01-6 TaxID=3028686 RepID=UPI0029BD11E1|nr:hypothetical protein [Streptomyces sp. ME19-01-6]MDX3227038.1 hypothetical protein [Streptomyces sp. ME19-01-6]